MPSDAPVPRRLVTMKPPLASSRVSIQVFHKGFNFSCDGRVKFPVPYFDLWKILVKVVILVNTRFAILGSQPDIVTRSDALGATQLQGDFSLVHISCVMR